jgi:hypothetical protein
VPSASKERPSKAVLRKPGGLAARLQRGETALGTWWSDAGLDLAAIVFATSSPLRAGCAGGLRPGLTQAARDGADEDGRDGATPLDRTEKPRHDGPGGNPGLYFRVGGNRGSGHDLHDHPKVGPRRDLMPKS